MVFMNHSHGAFGHHEAKKYQHYVENFDTSEIGTVYFVWICNYLPYYKNTYALATDVYSQNNG